MTRKVFDQELAILNRDIAELGAKVTDILADTTDALRRYDIELARRIFDDDFKINAAQNRIEQMCVNLIALQQPLASDLRSITAALKMITDVERVADQCADTCEILITYPNLGELKCPKTIINMFEIAREMFAAAIDSFIRKDADLALRVKDRDDEVDERFSKVVLELSKRIQTDQNSVPQATDYMFIAKYVERIADHATNIAEWAVYAKTGEHKNMSKHIARRRIGDVDAEV